MKHLVLLSAAMVAACVIASMPFDIGHADDEATPIFGIKMPPGYRDWRLISVAHEEGDLNDLRAILGNDVAITAYRDGTLPFPDGTIIARLAWSYDPSEENDKSLVVTNLSLPGRPRKGFSSWSRTRRNMPRPAAGGSLSSTMANRSTRRCLKHVSPVMSPQKGMTSSIRATHLEGRILGTLRLSRHASCSPMTTTAQPCRRRASPRTSAIHHPHRPQRRKSNVDLSTRETRQRQAPIAAQMVAVHPGPQPCPRRLYPVRATACSAPWCCG
jgi:hypothetical protein